MGNFLIWGGWHFNGSVVKKRRKGRGSFSFTFYSGTSIRSLVIKCHLSLGLGAVSWGWSSSQHKPVWMLQSVTFDYFWLQWDLQGAPVSIFFPRGHKKSKAAFIDYWFVWVVTLVLTNRLIGFLFRPLRVIVLWEHIASASDKAFVFSPGRAFPVFLPRVPCWMQLVDSSFQTNSCEFAKCFIAGSKL